MFCSGFAFDPTQIPDTPAGRADLGAGNYDKIVNGGDAFLTPTCRRFRFHCGSSRLGQSAEGLVNGDTVKELLVQHSTIIVPDVLQIFGKTVSDTI